MSTRAIPRGKTSTFSVFIDPISIGFRVPAPFALQRGADRFPRQPYVLRSVIEREHDALLDALQAADVEVRVGVLLQRNQIGGTFAHQFPSVVHGMPRGAREREVAVDEILRQVPQRSEVRADALSRNVPVLLVVGQVQDCPPATGRSRGFDLNPVRYSLSNSIVHQ